MQRILLGFIRGGKSIYRVYSVIIDALHSSLQIKHLLRRESTKKVTGDFNGRPLSFGITAVLLPALWNNHMAPPQGHNGKYWGREYSGW